MSDNNSQEINAEDLNLDEVVGMEPDDLTDVHKGFLEENKGSLTDEQSTKFGFDVGDGEGGEGGEGDDDKDDDKGGEGDDDKDDDKGGEGDDDKDDDKDIDPKDVEIKTKKRVGDLDEGEDDDEDDDEMDAEDRKKIKKVVNKSNRGIVRKQQELEDKQAVDSIISERPELKKHRAVALKYMKDPAYSRVPAQQILNMVSAEDQQKIGAAKERAAAKKAKNTQSGGSSNRSKPTGKNWGKASDEEVEAKILEVRSRGA